MQTEEFSIVSRKRVFLTETPPQSPEQTPIYRLLIVDEYSTLDVTVSEIQLINLHKSITSLLNKKS